MLGTIRGIEKKLRRHRWHLIGTGVQQQLANRLAQASPARLTGTDQFCRGRHQATRRQPLGQMTNLSGFAATVDPIENDEATSHIRKAKAFTTTVIELKAINRAAKGGESNTP